LHFHFRMRSLIFVCFIGLSSLAYAVEDPESFPQELAEVANADTPTDQKGPWTWEEIDGKKFKVYKHEDRIPHGFSKKVFIKKTRDHIIKYIRLKKCGCRVQTTRKTWVGPHKKLWHDDKHHHGHHVHHHGHKGCNGPKHVHNHHDDHHGHF
ncbi:hypothetical protein PMAYCL1PPCAC_30448, partial [Pristionchus mayeri]